MRQRLSEFIPTMLNMSFDSQVCLVLGVVIIACAVYLMKSPHFHEGISGRLVLLFTVVMAAVMPIEVYVNAGIATFEFSVSTKSYATGFGAIMVWLAWRAWRAGRRQRTCIASWPFHEAQSR